MPRRVLVVGGGGREHALAWALARSPSVAAIESAPGNPGMAELGPVHDVDPTDAAAIARLAQARSIELVVVGPELPLVAGVVDAVQAAGIAAFGPSAAAARIESSKAFAKDVMLAAGVATGAYAVFAEPGAAKEALEAQQPPYVVKADGLAGGKGVRVCDTLSEAHDAVDDALVRCRFGDAGARIVVEEYLDGPERSVFGVCDGEDVVLLPPAQDYKRALDGDGGLNTGGMGAFTPVPGFELDDVTGLADDVFRPVLRELARRDIPYRGLLYAGLVLTDAGLRVLEFNARFGDPETQVIVPRLAGDLGDLLWASATGAIAGIGVGWHDAAVVTVVLAAGGYPDTYATGHPILGVDGAVGHDGVTVFHAGTRTDGGRLVTAGGRVLDVTAHGATLAEARAAAYAAADEITWDGLHRRQDIALLPDQVGAGRRVQR